MKINKTVTQKELKGILNYDPISGKKQIYGKLHKRNC